MESLTVAAFRETLAFVKKQEDFFKLDRNFAPNRISHGDESCLGRRKLARPFRRHCAIHLVLKSERAVGHLNMLQAANRLRVDRILKAQAAKFSVKIHREQNVGNHLHCLLSCGRKESFQNFLRAVAGLIARTVLNGKSGKFWTQPPFTRLVSGRRDFVSMLNYLAKNLVEATEGKSARVSIEVQEAEARRERRRQLARIRRSRKKRRSVN